MHNQQHGPHTNDMPPSAMRSSLASRTPSPGALNTSSSSSSKPSPALDPYVGAKLPGAKPPVPKKPETLFQQPQQQTLTPRTKTEHPEWMSFSEKKRHFEKANSSTKTSDSNHVEEHSSESSMIHETSESKRFSFLSQSELEKLREEERKKLSNFSEEQLKSSILEREKEDDEYDEAEDKVSELLDANGGSVEYHEESFQDEAGRTQTRRIFRSKRAERVYFEKLGIDIESQEYANMTPAQRKAVEAEKRREWRQARLKSLEDDVTLKSMMDWKNIDQFLDSKRAEAIVEEH